ncbi:NAD-dependent epimerase/dehydratase family protein [Williamsia sp. CHRR-6]|uniref:NAD-dependent epimerase/dehydratase family protein n=1 Tax=Williamsia sp. CHRR-6 TaxID=2835871 RepID=UPI001BDA7F89|nr:NAD-dependent epimerase/dehydratase family protein [Williamsia sp. CHRR-6]MBT0565985.1 NAD-dependent epimerase/dehydratase family protein [Williamsia sp. CHRR-6]
MDTATAPPRVILVTGASTFLGGYLTTRLAQNPDIERVLAVDSRVPSKDMLRRMGRAEFVRADIRRPSIARIIDSAQVDTVVHAATSVMDTVGHTPAIKELNVIGAMQVIAACQRAPSVRRVVVRSTGMVYGSTASDPAHFAEETPALVEPTTGYGRDLLDVEGYARGLSRRRPDIAVTILRPAAILGPKISTRMSIYFSSPLIPVVLGHEPRLQFLHEEDALAAIEHATLLGRAGTYNLAADGVISLTQAIRRAGRVELPVPANLLGPVAGVFRNIRVATMHGDQASYLTYGRVLDTTRMRTELGFAPRYTSVETMDDFIARRPLDPVVSAAAWHRLERRITDAARSFVASA